MQISDRERNPEKTGGTLAFRPRIGIEFFWFDEQFSLGPLKIKVPFANNISRNRNKMTALLPV